jgi:glycosyltransferase involved in cell wall biosynthesis
MPLLSHRKLRVLGSGLENFNNFGDIEFIKNPISISHHLSRLDIALIPIFVGAGTRLKALEAMAFGLPIISTKKGVEGLDLDSWVHYVPAETAQEFVEAINHLDANSKFAHELSLRGIKLVNDRFSVDSLAGHLQELLLR